MYIEKLRYSFIEIEADNLALTQSVSQAVNPWLLYNNFPGSYSIAASSTLFNGNNITLPINQVATNSVVNQREYFFNKKKLDMVILSGPTYSLRFKKIRFVETDMIPFTQIADDCILFRTITFWNTTPAVVNPAGSYVGPSGGDPGYNGDDPNLPLGQLPYPGVWGNALPLGQQSTNFGIDGNLQEVPEFGPPTWDNFYLVFGGEGCISYINEDIQAPFRSKAPDINSDTEFNYLSATIIPLVENPITQ